MLQWLDAQSGAWVFVLLGIAYIAAIVWQKWRERAASLDMPCEQHGPDDDDDCFDEVDE